MCGIAGSTLAKDQVLNAMKNRLTHRGPDGNGLWREENIGFAHTRLAIIDLSSGGAQPMVSDCGRYVLAYNGEIYNYAELRTELAAAGDRFRSSSDAEVLLNLLRRHGLGGVHRLVGMFAFAFWDRESKELFLCRDRLGIKPLVYANLDGGQLAFASEISALKVHPGINLDIDGAALSDFLACLYVPAPSTIYRGIKKLPPGHILCWRDGKSRLEQYWTPSFNGQRLISLDDAVDELLPILQSAVASCMVADVPVGCFLSGGIDSSVIAALMASEAKRQGLPPIHTFTMTFDEAAYDERAQARDVAKHINSRHTELKASPRLADLLDDHLASFGEPFGNPTALLIHDLSRKAREHVAVALVGDGGDEVFAGYPRYRGGMLAGPYRRLPRWLRLGVLEPASRLIKDSVRGHHGWRRAREFMAGANHQDHEMYASWVEYFTPEERQKLLGASTTPSSPIAELYQKSFSSKPLDAMQQTDLLSFLPGNLLAYGDAMSMRFALELRLPLIDHRLVERVGGLAAELRFQGGMKCLLRGIARRLLPSQIVDAPKRGFNPPLAAWLQTDLAEMVKNRIKPDNMAALGLEWPPIAFLLGQQKEGLRDHSLKIWALLVLDAWRRL